MEIRSARIRVVFDQRTESGSRLAFVIGLRLDRRVPKPRGPGPRQMDTELDKTRGQVSERLLHSDSDQLVDRPSQRAQQGQTLAVGVRYHLALAGVALSSNATRLPPTR